VGAQIGGRLATGTGPAFVVRAGILVQLAGVLTAAAVLRTDIAWASLAATLALFGLGAGMASSQLTNVILSRAPRERAGSASGIATTNSSLGAALGVTILGAVLRTGTLTDSTSARGALLTAAVLLAAGSLASFTIPTSRDERGVRERSAASAGAHDAVEEHPSAVSRGMSDGLIHAAPTRASHTHR
jgi:MFS family permease